MKKLRVTVDGKTFEVVVEALDEQGKPAPFQQAAPAPSFQQTSVAPPPASAPSLTFIRRFRSAPSTSGFTTWPCKNYR
jgi:hypothetical protein